MGRDTTTPGTPGQLHGSGEFLFSAWELGLTAGHANTAGDVVEGFMDLLH